MQPYPLVNIQAGSLFKTEDGSVFLKLRNPEIPNLAKISDYDVWAADTGNGVIKKFKPWEVAILIGNCFANLESSQA